MKWNSKRNSLESTGIYRDDSSPFPKKSQATRSLFLSRNSKPPFPRFQSRREERKIHYTRAGADTSWRETAQRDDEANWLSREIQFYRGDANEIRGIKGNFQGGAELQNRRIILWTIAPCRDERERVVSERTQTTLLDALARTFHAFNTLSFVASVNRSATFITEQLIVFIQTQVGKCWTIESAPFRTITIFTNKGRFMCTSCSERFGNNEFFFYP